MNLQPPDYSAYKKALMDTVGFGEGTIKQDASGNWTKNPKLWFGYKDHIDPTKLNFHQLIEAQKSFLRKGKGSFYGGDSAAVGWAQMTYPETYVGAAGLKMTDLFTEENQDKLFLQYAKREAGVTPEMLAQQGFTREISTRLGKPWASMWGSKHGQQTKSYESWRDFFNKRFYYIFVFIIIFVAFSIDIFYIFFTICYLVYNIHSINRSSGHNSNDII